MLQIFLSEMKEAIGTVILTVDYIQHSGLIHNQLNIFWKFDQNIMMSCVLCGMMAEQMCRLSGFFHLQLEYVFSLFKRLKLSQLSDSHGCCVYFGHTSIS